MNLHVGTSGYSYKEWKGNFYPEDLPAKEMLAYYSRRLAAVEINNTFYRLPQASMIENWKAQVPADFRFSIKATQRITHIKRINNVADETKYLLETAALLEERLGVVLFQLPPNMKKDTARLKAFLNLFPCDDVVALGRIAASQLKDLDVDPHYVRHPASGGAKLFRQQIANTVARLKLGVFPLGQPQDTDFTASKTELLAEQLRDRA